MGSRDHSWECDVCGFAKGGLNDLTCACEQSYVMLVCGLDTLAHNLATAGALERAYKLGYRHATRMWTSDEAGYKPAWSPGCGRGAP